MDEPMWEYWRDKKGILEALEEQYPHLLKWDHPSGLAHIVSQARNILDLIDYKMEKIDGRYRDEDA